MVRARQPGRPAHQSHAAEPQQQRPRGASSNPPRIEDYALIGDCCTAALVGLDGSIDWLCWPRFDSPACFAALLGTQDNGFWRIAPDAARRVSRRYRPGTMILETTFETGEGSAVLIDFMTAGSSTSSIVRIVQGIRGRTRLHLDLAIRFDYGASVPWVTQPSHGHGLRAVAGPNLVMLRSHVPMHGRDLTTVADFTVGVGERVGFVMTHGVSHLADPVMPDAETALRDTESYWTTWSRRCSYRGEWREQVQRSLLTLKALAYEPTGGIVAAPTTSLPEHVGGERNWDYRYCWLRDATFTLLALMHAGYRDEARKWGAWLRRSVAGTPSQVQTLYGLAGERWQMEWEVPWLAGYQGSRPVRVGNAASGQLQLDVYGELMDALYQEMHSGLAKPQDSWDIQRALIEHLTQIWQEPDESIWEVRGGPQHFTFSKAMAWVAFDRAIRVAEEFHLQAPLEQWRALRSEIHQSVCRNGYSSDKQSFVQSYGGSELDASLLLLPLVGFLPPHDPRIKGTVAAIERELMLDGLVQRYRTHGGVDGLPPGEGVFLACSFWFVDNLVLQGERKKARAMFQRLLALANDVGLLAEEYDPRERRQLGNFPQAFSHLALINAALNLDNHGPAQKRGGHGMHHASN